jgi:hypothetical protein
MGNGLRKEGEDLLVMFEKEELEGTILRRMKS